MTIFFAERMKFLPEGSYNICDTLELSEFFKFLKDSKDTIKICFPTSNSICKFLIDSVGNFELLTPDVFRKEVENSDICYVYSGGRILKLYKQIRQYSLL